MRQIIAEHGWPTIRLVGADGAHGAWLLVQHADATPAFQEDCLVLLEKAVSTSEASKLDCAYLTYGVRVSHGMKQLYGTQGVFLPNGRLVPQPIDHEANVDKRRRLVGLGPIAEYYKRLNEIYDSFKKPSSS